MGSYLAQAEVALRVYIERGETALFHLAGGDLDAANEILKWRDAAFANLKVIAYLDARQGGSIYDSTPMKDLWVKIKKVNLDLEKQLENALCDLDSQLEKSVDKRKKIAKFRSRVRARESIIDIV